MSELLNPGEPRRQVAPLLALATQSLRAGRPADAIPPLREAALMEPLDPIIQHDLGLACLEVGYIPDAIEALQRSVAVKPVYADAHFRLGIALEKYGDIGAAIVAYHRATQVAIFLDGGMVSRGCSGLRTGPSRRSDWMLSTRRGDRRQNEFRAARQGARAADRRARTRKLNKYCARR